ncbi:MAG: lipoyl-dependent peroxiredoxin [Solirubrobacteraceae bacterium]|jgi:osmotically inducible protein OsmC|nr:lipoyl-dependent peroxiredoxin [Solirubrobacteraceae bacterium]
MVRAGTVAAMPKNTATATWTGSLKEGNGHLVTGNGGFDGNFTFRSRFEDGEGTNPEELIGAAHAGCFSMQLNAFLYDEGIEPESVVTEAEVTARPVDGTPTIVSIALRCTVTAPGADEAKIRELGDKAKSGCIISRALAGVEDISLELTVA